VAQKLTSAGLSGLGFDSSYLGREISLTVEEVNMRFKDKIVLVTGAASGIGLAITRQFSNEGATVIGTDINEQALSDMKAQELPSLVTKASDAGDFAAIAKLCDWIKQEFGALDVLVNNAGYAVLKNPEQIEEAEYMAQMAVLLNGPVFLVKHLAGLLRASDNGSVINISSASAVLSIPGYCPYGTAKEAIAKFSEDCVITVPGIRHNAVLPGVIETPILQAAYGKEATKNVSQFIQSNNPVPRLGCGKDIADAVLFLASDEATYINGTKLLVDGGLSKVHGLTLVGSS
jgi:NAD(P)-dependent dehydrogenase (short-subunit alcohol dehydrogenase family)